MARHSDIVTWAVVVPGRGDTLREAVHEAWERLVGGERRDRNLVEWTIVEGPDHTVVVDHNPGSIDILDLALVRLLSRTFPGSHYLLNLQDDPGRIAVYMRGRRQRWVERSNAELATDLGLPLPGGPEPPSLSDPQASLLGCLVVEGFSGPEVAAVIAASDENHPVSLERGKIGCVVYPASLGAPPPRLAPLLGRGLPDDATLYTVLSKPSEGRFHVSVDRAGSVVGIFDVPEASGLHGIPALPDILGETTPERILAKLGIDPLRLGFEDESITEPGDSEFPLWTEDEPTWRADELEGPDPEGWEEDLPTATDA